MDNGILQVTLSKPDGNVTGIKYNSIDNVLEVDDKENHRGYMISIINIKPLCLSPIMIIQLIPKFKFTQIDSVYDAGTGTLCGTRGLEEQRERSMSMQEKNSY